MTTKTKRIDAYQARLVVSVPLDLTNASSYSDAVEAVKELQIGIPGATVEIVSASLVKVTAPVEPAPARLQTVGLAITSNAAPASTLGDIPAHLDRRPPKSAA